MAEFAARMIADPERAATMNTVYCFQIEDIPGGMWSFRCKNPVGLEEDSRQAECMLTMSLSTFSAIYKRELNPQVAFLEGKVRLSGQPLLALRLAKLGFWG